MNTVIGFKELGKFGKELQVLKYKRVYNESLLPNNEKKEIVFLGKSNVGKSSLINTLLNYKITKTSKKPGCTKWIGFLELKNINLIDLPGYGYASVSKGRKEFWDQMIYNYIKKERTYAVFLLIDSRKGIEEIDEKVAELFLFCPRIFLIYTKSDEIRKKNEDNFYVSTKNGEGILKLREVISEVSL